MKTLRRIDQKELTRKNLIETSMDIFSKKGFVSTNTAELAKSAGVSHGTIFLHFPQREDLICAVMNEFGDRLAGRFEEVAQQSTGVASVLEAHLQVIAEFEDFYTHLIRELYALPEKVKSRFFILQASISRRIHTEAEKEMAAKTIKKIERHRFFNTWIALLHYYLANNDIFSPDESLISSKGQELLQHFMFLIKKG